MSTALAPPLGSRIILLEGKKRYARYNGSVARVIKGRHNGWITVRLEDTEEELGWRLSKTSQTWTIMPKSIKEARTKSKDSSELGRSFFESSSFCEFYLDQNFHGKMAQLARTLMPEAKVTYLPGGSFNRVIKIIQGDSQFVLRWPREAKPLWRVAGDVAVLEYLQNNIPSLPVPRVLHKNLSAARYGPWVIHEWLPGESLSIPYLDSLTDDDLVRLSREIAKFFVSMYSTYPCHGYGTLVAAEGKLAVGKPVVGEMCRDEEVFSYLYDPAYQAPATLLSFITERLLLMYASAENNLKTKVGRSSDCFAVAYLPCLVSAAEDLVPADILSGFCLFHPDTKPHNFLAGKSKVCRCFEHKCPLDHGKSHLRLSGILDWDDCEILPPALAFRLPMWLWSEEENLVSMSMSAAVPCNQNPDIPPHDPRKVLVRDIVIQELEKGLPGFMDVVRCSFKSGVLGLGYLARRGLTGNSSMKLVRDLLQKTDIDLQTPGKQHRALLATLHNQ